jgi:4-diphosphocytidyl-2-C-methyl-D-erythritol kinase
MINVTAPAKINITLEALKKRPDGYHEIRSIVQTLNFYDNLRFRPGSKIEIKCNLSGWSISKSLVSKTVDLLRNSTRSTQGAIIEIEKRIPLQSGLGGDSSDAAAVLRGLNMLWNLQLSLRDLLALGSQLGSDVSLFLYGGTVLVEGRGEKVRPLHPLPHMFAILLVPSIPQIENKTHQLYARLTARDYTRGKITEALIKLLEGSTTGLAANLFNVFDEVGPEFFTGLKDYRQEFLDAGASDIHLAGSGPTLFTLLRDEIKAGDICKRLRAKGLEVYLTDF